MKTEALSFFETSVTIRESIAVPLPQSGRYAPKVMRQDDMAMAKEM